MVTNRRKHSEKTPVKQGPEDIAPEPNKINASTPYDFNGRNLTPYGGLLPILTMLERLGFQPLVEQTVTSKRIPRAMDLYRFVLGIVLGLYIGFPRLNQFLLSPTCLIDQRCSAFFPSRWVDWVSGA